MDQRHAGGSRANLTPFRYDDALGDQLAVLDHAGVASAHILGMGIGAAYALKLAYDAPARVRSVGLVHPIGVDESNELGDHYRIFNETIRIARAEGLDGVIAAACENPCFSDNPAGGPWAQRLHDEPAFRDALRSLGREMYIALVVDFRDGMFPAGRRFFSINDVAVTRIQAPLHVVPGDDRRHPASIARAIANMAPHAECAETGLGGKGLARGVGRLFAAADAIAAERTSEEA
jgi:pimeloyl-ACP methyl ester carboxylesterase